MPTSAYRTAIINDTPVFYSPLDEASNPTDRKSLAVLEAVNGPTGASSFSSGWAFNGTDQCLLAAAPALDQVAGWIGATGKFSLELWFKQDNGWGGANVRFAVRWGGYGIFLRFYGFPSPDQTGYVIGGFYSDDAQERKAEKHGTWFNDAWHHAVITFDRPTLSLYVDGALVQTDTRDFDVQITDTGSNFIGIGRDGPFSSGFFPGSVDDVAIYNYALTGSQISAHFAASKTETVGDDPALADPSGPAPRQPPEGIASSFHAWWDTVIEDDVLHKEFLVDLRVLKQPTVTDLYFWALQCSFLADMSTPVVVGGAHTGLQWNSAHPGSKAINWGGYDQYNVLLTGSVSSFPSTPANANTRDFTWIVGQTYRFRIWIPGPDLVAASVDGVLIRELDVPGVEWLTSPTMWSEVFAECSAPSVLVSWSNFRAIDDAATPATSSEHAFFLSYQSELNDGCPNTNTYEYGNSIRQETNVTRITP